MKVFISWSGSLSKEIAVLFSEFLNDVIQSLEIFISTETEKGIVWFDSIQSELKSSKYCIIFLTKSNISKPWINFEAGAIANKQEKTNVTSLLINLSPSDVPLPLSLFQNTVLQKDDVLKLIKNINNANDNQSIINEKQLEKHFNNWWIDFNKKSEKIIHKYSADLDEMKERSERELLSELLENSKATSDVLSNVSNSIGKILISELSRYSYTYDYEKKLDTLTERESELIRLYFGLNKARPFSLEEISKRWNLSMKDLERVFIKALLRLRFHKGK